MKIISYCIKKTFDDLSCVISKAYLYKVINYEHINEEIICLQLPYNYQDVLLKNSSLQLELVYYNQLFNLKKTKQILNIIYIYSKLEQLNILTDQILLYNFDSSIIYPKHSILCRKILQGTSLFNLLNEDFVDDELWKDLGCLIAKLHMNGIRHNNLTAHNIILCEGQWYIIEFFKSKIQKPNYNGWCYFDLRKLLNSLNKHKHDDYILFNRDQWITLLDAYSYYLKDHGEVESWLS